MPAVASPPLPRFLLAGCINAGKRTLLYQISKRWRTFPLTNGGLLEGNRVIPNHADPHDPVVTRQLTIGMDVKELEFELPNGQRAALVCVYLADGPAHRAAPTVLPPSSPNPRWWWWWWWLQVRRKLLRHSSVC